MFFAEQILSSFINASYRNVVPYKSF